MLPLKTEHARTVLQGHRTALDMRQRRLLILCDGKRDVAALSALLGPDTPDRVAGLIEAGYLEVAAARVHGLTAAPSPVTEAPAQRRSLVAARIYLVGILELQRHPEAGTLLRGMQQARSEADVILAMQEAITALPALTSVGYGTRVRQRLLEVMPLAYAAPFQGIEGAHPA